MKNLFWIFLIIGVIAGIVYWLKQQDTSRIAGGILPTPLEPQRMNGLRGRVISQYG